MIKIMYQAFLRSSRAVSDVELKMIRKSFEFADLKKDGYLDRAEFKIAYLAVFGCKPSKFEVNDIMEKYGKISSKLSKNGDEDMYCVIDFEAFKRITHERLKYTDIDDDIRETFQIIDARCKGFVDFNDFQKLILKFLPSFDPLRMRRIFNEVDRDNDGRVSYRDFQLLMKHDLK